MTEEQKKIYEALMAYCESHKDRPFVPRELVAHMEPVFKEMGFRGEALPEERHRILAVKDDAAGDFVLFSPFLRELRRLYPKAHITLFGSDRNEELAKCCPYIDNLLVKNLEKEVGPFWEMFPILARQAVDYFVPYHFELGFCSCVGLNTPGLLLMYMGGVNRRVSYTQIRQDIHGRIKDAGWDAMLTVPVPFLLVRQSDTDRDLYLLEYLLQLPIADRHLELWTLAADKEEAQRAVAPLLSSKGIRRIYTVMPCTSERFREWPVERFVEMLKVIMEQEEDLGLVIMGGLRDTSRAEALAKAFPGRALSLAGKIPFRVSAEVVGLTEKYIGADTALMHIAAAKHVPVLTTFPFPADLQLHPLSMPFRFQPYKVPSVIVLPQSAAGAQCRQLYGTGCAVTGEPHCILNISVETMLKGYAYLGKRIEEQRLGAMVIK